VHDHPLLQKRFLLYLLCALTVMQRCPRHLRLKVQYVWHKMHVHALAVHYSSSLTSRSRPVEAGMEQEDFVLERQESARRHVDAVRALQRPLTRVTMALEEQPGLMSTVVTEIANVMKRLQEGGLDSESL